MHRDYSHYSGYVAIVVFDDRIEIRSFGRLPNGITVKQLSGRHDSKPTTPSIAGAFHRTGAVEVWGRGINRVIAMCRKHGAPPPVFEEKQGFLVVTFRAPLVAAGAAGTSRSESGGQITAEVTAQVAAFCREPQPAKAIMAELGLKHWKTFRANSLAPLMAMGILERTIPNRPRSRMQRYRTTDAGIAAWRNSVRGKAENAHDDHARNSPRMVPWPARGFPEAPISPASRRYTEGMMTTCGT